MSLTELIAGVEAEEKTLTVYNADDAVEELRARFADRNVTVEADHTTAGPERFLVLGHGEEFLAATGIDALLERSDAESPGLEDDPYRPILDHLDETMFTSYGRRKMLAASREIEDRAWRVGTGQLHAGFQRMSTLATRLEPYVALGERDSLTVHVYATPDEPIPEQDAFVVHPEGADEIANSWFVAYDGAGLEENKCALLAEEREPGSFYGFWTYDPDTVDYIIDHLSSRYLPLDTDGRSTSQP